MRLFGHVNELRDGLSTALYILSARAFIDRKERITSQSTLHRTELGWGNRSKAHDEEKVVRRDAAARLTSIGSLKLATLQQTEPRPNSCSDIVDL